MKKKQRLVWFMNISYKGAKTVSPCIAKEGEAGYHKTDIIWNLGEHFSWEDAENFCKKRNQDMGISPDEAQRVVDETIALQIRLEN